MSADLEFLLGLLEQDDPAHAAAEDLFGPHGNALRLGQRLGFVGRVPGVNPAPSCPYCGEGVPYRLGEQSICPRCHSRVDPRHLLLWPVDLEAFLRWLALRLRLRGGVRRIDANFWQLGTRTEGREARECFYCRAGLLSERACDRLDAYPGAVLLYGGVRPAKELRDRVSCIALLGLLRLGRTLQVTGTLESAAHRNAVRFDAASGALWVGAGLLGEVPFGSKEYHFLHCLASRIDRFIPYRDLKRCVLQQSESADTTEEATFCQGLKSRIKKKWIPEIDRLVVTTNKGDGYRLRAHARAAPARQGVLCKTSTRTPASTRFDPSKSSRSTKRLAVKGETTGE